MNAAARALAQGTFATTGGRLVTLSSQMIGIILLFIAVLASALAVVYVKDLNRQLFYDTQNLKKVHEELQIQTNQLLLEQDTWSASTRIQTIAEQKLGMILPASKDMILVSLSSKKYMPRV